MSKYELQKQEQQMKLMEEEYQSAYQDIQHKYDEINNNLLADNAYLKSKLNESYEQVCLFKVL